MQECSKRHAHTQMKKDLAEVKVYAEAMADSNQARDAYVDKEQDKFFHCQDMVFFELVFRPIRLITGRLPITFLPFLLFSHDFMTL